MKFGGSDKSGWIKRQRREWRGGQGEHRRVMGFVVEAGRLVATHTSRCAETRPRPQQPSFHPWMRMDAIALAIIIPFLNVTLTCPLSFLRLVAIHVSLFQTFAKKSFRFLWPARGRACNNLFFLLPVNDEMAIRSSLDRKIVAFRPLLLTIRGIVFPSLNRPFVNLFFVPTCVSILLLLLLQL